jgi:HK97 family phage portal protein
VNCSQHNELVAFSVARAFRQVLASWEAWRSSWLRGDSFSNAPALPFNFAGLQLTKDDAMMLSAVWACMDVIAKNIGASPTNVYEPIEGTKRRKRIEKDNRIWLLNVRPNDEMTAIGFKEAMFFSALGDGNAYAEIGRDCGGRVAALWPISCDRVKPARDGDGSLYYDVSEPDGSVRRLEARDVIHLRGPTISGLMGENLVARAARTLAVAAAHERFSASFYGRGATLGGVVKMPGKLTEPQKESLRESWEKNHAGLGKAQRLLVLEGGAEFTPTTAKPVDAQLVDDKKFSVEEIARWWGVPLHKIQHLEHATFSNIEHQGLDFVTGCLFPWCVRYTQELNAKVFNSGSKGPWWYAEIDLSHLVRGDSQSRALAASSWVQNGVKTRNEVRAEEGLDDAGAEGDLLTIQSNMTTLNRIGTVQPAPTLAEPNPKQAAAAKAITAALSSACARYARRLANRIEALQGDELERFSQLKQFREEQIDVLVEDMSFFDELTREALGTSFTRELAAKCIAAHERGAPVQFVIPVPQLRLGAA